MDIRKVGSLQTPTLDKAGKAQGLKDGPSFKEALERLNGLGGVGAGQPAGLAGGVAATNPIKFSNHAVERMQSRGISFTPQDLQRLGEAVGKAAGKGSQNSLVLLGENALVVSVKNNTVVTVMDKNSMKENVFTNIDSTVVM